MMLTIWADYINIRDLWTIFLMDCGHPIFQPIRQQSVGKWHEVRDMFDFAVLIR